MLIKIIKLLFIFILSFFISCAPPQPQITIVGCPVKTQNCKPGEWKGIIYDTSYSIVKTLPYYYKFEPVQQINTTNNEWSLSFLSQSKAALLFNDSIRQKLVIVRMITENRASIEEGIGVPIQGNLGSISLNKNIVVSSAVKSNELLGKSEIFTAQLSDNMLVNYQKLGKSINYDNYTWQAQPFFSPEGNLIIFASDRPGGLGGTDLWFSIKLIDGNWSEPINCGDSVNTECDEITPFISNDGRKLFYSSTGHTTVGGYDIFSADISKELWLKAKFRDLSTLSKNNYFTNNWNLRPPLNTKYDEIYPSSPFEPDSLLYYSSNQIETGKNNTNEKQSFDIYVRRKLIPSEYISQTERGTIPEAKVPEIEIKENLLPIKSFTVTNYSVVGKIYDASLKTIIKNADLVLTNRLDTIPLKSSVSTLDGSYRFDDLIKGVAYNLVAQAPSYFYDSFIAKIEPADTTTIIIKDFFLPLIFTLRVNFHYDKFDEPYPNTLDSNGLETNRTWTEELDILAQAIRTHQSQVEKIELSGNTDDVGSDQYNYQLGLKRVNFIIDELVKRGVPKDILKGRSAGKKELLPFRSADEDIDIRRKRCRRIEFRITLKD